MFCMTWLELPSPNPDSYQYWLCSVYSTGILGRWCHQLQVVPRVCRSLRWHGTITPVSWLRTILSDAITLPSPCSSQLSQNLIVDWLDYLPSWTFPQRCSLPESTSMDHFIFISVSTSSFLQHKLYKLITISVLSNNIDSRVKVSCDRLSSCSAGKT